MTLEELHQKQLSMLECFDKFCRENGLTYFLAYGTLIGAIRHKGFIPWDDDVDIWMKREDYDRFVSFTKINETLRIVTKENSQGYYHPYSYCNVTDTETIMDEHITKKETGKGVFLDIFPLDTLPGDYDDALKYLKRCRRMAQIQSCCVNKPPKGIKGVIKRVIALCVNWDKMYIDLQNEARKYQGKKSQYIGVPTFVWNPAKETLGTKDFECAIECEFEGKRLLIPVGYDKILTMLYGDYMTPPSVDMQKGHHMVDYFVK